MKPNFAIFSETLDYALGWMVIHSIWQATVTALVAGVLMVVLRKKEAKVRYLVSNMALIGVLLAAIVTFSFYYNISKEDGTLTFTPLNVGNNTQLASNTEPALSSDRGGVVPNIDPLNGVNSTKALDNSNASLMQSLSLAVFKEYFNRNLPLILIIWVLGVTVFLLRLLGGLSYIHYLRNRMNFPTDEYWTDLILDLSKRAGLKQSVELVESAMVRTPMVLGHLKPMILFPMGVINRLSPEEVEAILAHELAHILRKDYIFNILQSVIEALFFFHPAVWWLSSQVRNERESACDDIAINLIQNKMNYARALVAIQEMAYFPMTPALAFAGQRKSQLMIRMQRILNQPNNKTNVMEKLTATSILIFLIIGLSFGSNLTEDNTLLSMRDNQMNINQLNPLSDTIPTASKDGDYNYEDNIQKVKMTVKDNKISKLVVNGVSIAESDIPNFEKLTNKILRKNEANEESVKAKFSGIVKKPGQEIRLDNLTDMIDIDKIGGGDVVFSETNDGSMKVKGKDGSTVLIEHGDDNSQIVTTTDKYGNVNKVITDKNGVTRAENYDNRGNLKSKSTISTTNDGANTIVQSEDSNGNTNTVRSNKNGITTIDNNQNGKISKTYIDGDVVTSIDNDGIKTVYDKDADGNATVKVYDKKGNYIETISFIDDKAYLNGKEMSADELAKRGFVKNKYGKGFNRNGGFNNIQPLNNNRNNTRNNNRNKQTSYGNTYQNDDNEDLASQIEDFKQEVKELRQEIKECGCTDSFDFRMGLIEELDRLFPAYKAQNQNVLSAFEKRFLKIKNDWERGDCDDNNSKSKNKISQTSDGFYSYGYGDSVADAEKARKDAEKRVKDAQNRNVEAQRRAQESKRIAGIDMQRAKLAETRASANSEDSRESKAQKSVFINLKNMGYITENKRCTVEFGQEYVSVDTSNILFVFSL